MSTESPQEVKTLSNQVQGLFAELTQANEQSHKKYDSLFENQQRNLAEEIATKQEQIQKLTLAVEGYEKKNKELHERTETLERNAARPGMGTKSSDLRKSKEHVEYLKHFVSFMDNRRGSEPLNTEEVREYVKKAICDKYHFSGEAKAHISADNVQGGFELLPSLAPFDITQEFETTPIRSIARIFSVSTPSLVVPIRDQKLSNVGLGTELSIPPIGVTPEIGQLLINVETLEVEVPITTQFLEDSPVNMEQFINEEIAMEFSLVENDRFVNGIGGNTIRGFLQVPPSSVPGTYERDTLERLITANVASITADDLVRTQGKLKPRYKPPARWLMPRETFVEVVLLKDGAGGFLINPALLPQGAPPVLLGAPVLMAEDMPTFDTGSGADIIAYGDFRVGYTIVDRIGITILRDPYTKRKFVQFIATKRVGGDVTNYEAIKIVRLQ